MSNLLQEDNSQPGIWRYHKNFPVIDSRFRLSLDEGSTPEIKFNGVIFKREDLNPTGSLKDRGLAYQISKYHEKGIKSLVISSSGNAAISAAAYCRLAQIELHVFASPKINRNKLARIQELGAQVNLTLRAVSEAVKFAKREGLVNLRPSQEESGPLGYKSVAYELNSHLGKIDSLFIPVSSGTALLGIALGFKDLGYLPRFHLAQTSAVNGLASSFDKDFKASNDSLADALVAKFVPRKKLILEVVKESSGWGWVVENNQIKAAGEELERAGIYTSAEGAVAFAAIHKARLMNKDLGEKVVCLLTGRKY